MRHRLPAVLAAVALAAAACTSAPTTGGPAPSGPGATGAPSPGPDGSPAAGPDRPPPPDGPLDADGPDADGAAVDPGPVADDPRRPLAPGLATCPDDPAPAPAPVGGGDGPPDDTRPVVPYTPACGAADLAAAIVDAERVSRDPGRSDAERGTAGFRSQLAHRQLATNPVWHDEVLDALPDDLRATTELLLAARGSLDDLADGYERPTRLPAWRLVPPADPDDLRTWYREAAAAEGVPWEVLAAINLVETRMGRIRGLSSAGARGPMQFIPASWEIFGAGGDVDDDRDAIRAAARHLAGRPGLTGPDFDRDRALFAYNNSEDYVRAVGAYADVLSLAPEALHGFWGWQVFYAADGITAWLPVGWRSDGGEAAADHAARTPVVGTAPELGAPSRG